MSNHENRHYGDLADSMATDPNRLPEETETAINWLKPWNRIRVESGVKSIMKRLVLHPKFRLDWYSTAGDGNKDYQRVNGREYEAGDGHDRRKPVYYVAGTLPHGVLFLSAEGRSTSKNSHVVSSQVLDWDFEEEDDAD